MNKNILFVGLFIVFVAMTSIVIAAKDDAAEQSQSVPDAKNMTYGQCVSAGAIVKNTCYDNVKSTYGTCKVNAQNQTESKTETKNCLSSYKKDKNQCKSDFKAVKNDCKKIKHNFVDEMGVMFK